MSPLARAAALGVALSLLPAAAQAADRPVFALKPVGHDALGYYRFASGPGREIHGRVRVVNAGPVAGTAELAVVDATTGSTTGAVYRTVGSAAADVGSWLRLDRGSVTLAPGAAAIVGFTVTVPADARRGQHLGGLVARPTTASTVAGAKEGKHSFRVDVVDQSILAVQVDLPGPARGLLALRDVKAGGNPGYQTLLLALSNPGERMVKGSGEVVVRGASGAVVKRQRFAIDTFLPRTRIDYPLVVRGEPLVPGDYRAEVHLRWQGGQESSTTLPFALTRHNIEQAYGSTGLKALRPAGGGGGVPVLPIALGGLALLLVLAGVVWSFRRRTRELERRLAAVAAGLDAQPGEITIADARGERIGSR